MPGFAVTLAGIPAPTNASILQELRDRFSEGYVFRVPAAPLAAGNVANYSEGVADVVLESARDCVFGTTRRPSGFCRNPSRACVLNSDSKKHCDKSDGAQCYLTKPDFLVVIFQGGNNEEILLNKLHFSAFVVRIPDDCYGKMRKTLEFVIYALDFATQYLKSIATEISSKNSPLLLPPDNFKGDKIRKLLNAASSGEFYKELRRFRAEHFSKEALSYLARKKQLAFKPTESSHQHGTAGFQERADLALSRHHRLGCAYAPDLHYDVTRTNGREFDGSTIFKCRESGDSYPEGTHVNVLVDDCLRP